MLINAILICYLIDDITFDIQMELINQLKSIYKEIYKIKRINMDNNQQMQEKDKKMQDYERKLQEIKVYSKGEKIRYGIIFSIIWIVALFQIGAACFFFSIPNSNSIYLQLGWLLCGLLLLVLTGYQYHTIYRVVNTVKQDSDKKSNFMILSLVLMCFMGMYIGWILRESLIMHIFMGYICPGLFLVTMMITTWELTIRKDRTQIPYIFGYIFIIIVVGLYLYLCLHFEFNLSDLGSYILKFIGVVFLHFLKNMDIDLRNAK